MIYLLPSDTCYWIACPIDDKKNYEKIYKIKKRSLDKPLAIMVENFNWLEQNTNLTKDQINFLKNYEKPFTILTDSNYVKMWLNFEDEIDWTFINKDIYNQIAFRVANLPEQKKLIKKVWPIFLTSANLSNNPEIYKSKDLITHFSYYLEKWIIKLIDSWNLDPNNKSSDIFEFIWDSLDIKYLRKN